MTFGRLSAETCTTCVRVASRCFGERYAAMRTINSLRAQTIQPRIELYYRQHVWVNDEIILLRLNMREGIIRTRVKWAERASPSFSVHSGHVKQLLPQLWCSRLGCRGQAGRLHHKLFRYTSLDCLAGNHRDQRENMKMLGNVIQLLATLVQLYSFVLLARILLSWIPNVNRSNQIVQFLYQSTEPVLEPVRRAMPRLGTIDISPIVVFIGLRMLQSFLLNMAVDV